MNNPFKDYITKNIKWKDHREFLDLEDAKDDNDKDKVMEIIIRMFKEGRIKW